MTQLARPSGEQLRRTAVVYVRQSSMTQVRNNFESQERQYELVALAVSLGWGREQVVVIDDDLGRSGSESMSRTGFQRLVADVGLGHVGVVVSSEVSRLARRNSDWYNLMDLCALTNTLIADNDGIYHPADYNSRLVLGLKGTMAEAELHLIRHRLTEGLRHKAAKGKLRQNLPVGFDYDEHDNVVQCADESVRSAISEVFRRFSLLGSARQVVASLREDSLRLPRRPNGSPTTVWADATYPAVHDLLTNPSYAGAFVFGRTRTDRKLDDLGHIIVRTRAVARDEWEICIQEHHRGYVDWDTYLANEARLSANARRPRGEGGGAARKGGALLQGLLRCGRCGRMMQVTYAGTTGNVPRYACVRSLHLYGSSSACQSLGGRRLEQVVLSEVFAALAPARLAATAKALREAGAEHTRSTSVFETALERARFEAERARRQFDAVEPENRLVARSLEAEWEARLGELARAEAALASQRARRPVSLSAEEESWLSRTGADLRAVFDAPSTTNVERKQLLRAVLGEVVVTVKTEEATAELRICFDGGASVLRSMAINRRGQHNRVTDEGTVDLLRRLAEHYDDDKIAQILSRQGRKTATGLSFNRARVAELRVSRGIPIGPRSAVGGAEDGNVVSLTEAERILGVSKATLYRWLRDGFIKGVQLTAAGPWHIRIDEALKARVVPEVPAGWVGLEEAARLLGVARQTVLDRVRRGELRAVHVNRGRRRGLAIEVGEIGAQADRLFS
jgi:excisionase family DNA binding protein